MLKKYLLLALATVFLMFQLVSNPANAAVLDDATRTVALNDSGEIITLSVKQTLNGRDKFNYACATCHVGGDTKTNPTINLAPGTLANATPSRDNVEALVDYMKNPTTYDGFEEIAEVHPSTQSADIFPTMRSLTDQDLRDIAGHILMQPAIVGEQWGGGKAPR
jgi:photosystem II cytochrome c550